MRVQTEEWRRFTPGVRMHNGEKTLFYNGETLWEGDEHDGWPVVHDEEERDSWKVIIVLPGVEVVPELTFYECSNVKTVIMNDSVKRVENEAFFCCFSLVFVKLSRNLEFIGEWAFYACKALTSNFIPLSCRDIGKKAFAGCKKLIILGLPTQTTLGQNVMKGTALIEVSPFDADVEYIQESNVEINNWIKSINDDEKFALHRACSAFNPQAESIYAIVKRVGVQAFQEPNSIGITPSQYLEANYFARVDQTKIINRYILDLMGEIV